MLGVAPEKPALPTGKSYPRRRLMSAVCSTPSPGPMRFQVLPPWIVASERLSSPDPALLPNHRNAFQLSAATLQGLNVAALILTLCVYLV